MNMSEIRQARKPLLLSSGQFNSLGRDRHSPLFGMTILPWQRVRITQREDGGLDWYKETWWQELICEFRDCWNFLFKRERAQ